MRKNGGRRARRVRKYHAVASRALIGRIGRYTKGSMKPLEWTLPLRDIDKLYWASRSVKKSRMKRSNPLTKTEEKRLRAWAAGSLRVGRARSGRKRGAYLGQAAGILGALMVATPRAARANRYSRASIRALGMATGERLSPRALQRLRNPLLQVVMPNKRKKNPAVRGTNPKVRGAQRIKVGGFVSEREARTYPGFAQALALHRSFHGRAPVHFTRVRLEDGDPHVTRKAVVMIGEAPAIEYRTWKHANSAKSFTKDGRRITWRHKMGELGGKPAYYVHDPRSGVTSLLGGTYRIAGKPAFYHH